MMKNNSTNPEREMVNYERWVPIAGEPNYYSRYQNDFLKAKCFKPKQIRWLFEDLFPIGEISLIVGYPEVGKTTIGAAFGALASNRNLSQPFGEKGSIAADTHGAVLWVALEDDIETTLLTRAIAAGADQEELAFWLQKRSNQYQCRQKTSQEPEIFQRIREYPGIVLVMFDSVELIYTDYPETKSGRKQALLDITNLARTMGFAVIANAHYCKSATKTSNPLDRISGGSLLGQTVRKVMFVEEMQRDDSGTDPSTYALFDTKTSNSNVINGLKFTIESTSIEFEKETFLTSRIKWLGRVERQQIVELESRSRKLYEPRSKIGLEDAVAFVHEFLAAGPRLASDLTVAAKGAKISNKLLSSARKELGVQAKKQEQAGQFSRWLCCLPEDDSVSSNSEVAP